MAKPIKDTPILYGKESDRFLREVKKTSPEKYLIKSVKSMKSHNIRNHNAECQNLTP